MLQENFLLETIALNLFRQGISLEMIAQATGLSIAQLEELQQEMP
jgi:hypothetical protein